MKKLCLIFVALVCLLAFGSGAVLAMDYIPPPGVLAPEEVDFGGKTVTIVIGAVPPDEDRGKDKIAEAEVLFNVKIEQVLAPNVDWIMGRIMANDADYDIIRMPHRDGYFPLVSANMLLPADDYLPEEFFDNLPSNDRYTIEKLKYDGKRYGIGIMHGAVNETMMITSYNKDLLEQEGQPDPYQLYLDGEWTYDAMEAIATAITKDTTGDGRIDQRGITAINNYQAFIRFAGSNGAETAKPDEDGVWRYEFNSAAAVEALNRIKQWTDSGIMGDGEYNAGKVGFVMHTHLAGNRHAQAAGINFGLVPMPMGPHVDSYQYPTFNFEIMFLPVNVEYPEGLIALANFIYREEDTYKWLDEMVNLWMVTREHMEFYFNAASSWQGEGDAMQGTELWDMMSGPIMAALRGEKGAAAAMDEVAQQAQSYLDDLFNQ